MFHTITENKEGIRIYIKEKRIQLTAEEKEEKSVLTAARAVKLLEEFCLLHETGWLYCYMDLQKEAGTREIFSWCWKHGIRTAVPRVSGRHMDFYEIASPEDCTAGTMGILEPKDTCAPAAEASGGRSLTCPVIVPGVAFGTDGSRIGYGGGYYDRFFEREREHTAVGYCFDFQTASSVPAETHDKRMDFLITETSALMIE
ncbi:5-formyltetrahydrofolate cyclo-ligase [Clostridium sp. AM58-1XD]|uniref:5-formyltetrahydrofolate cyclo-ligase n=1 Tax=Clostridium sp. AM58-1XD TaxID=2292307 RepID=UPI000E479C44|nr:5-formyltetrahydrofolate cyclo-ligase [Clostridium sp. AM58-1XD]RGZ01486.1 5-formyltetrahydrofolate cyclo-ligase [Clostridium sp. AM58-1XD]